MGGREKKRIKDGAGKGGKNKCNSGASPGSTRLEILTWRGKGLRSEGRGISIITEVTDERERERENWSTFMCGISGN